MTVWLLNDSGCTAFALRESLLQFLRFRKFHLHVGHGSGALGSLGSLRSHRDGWSRGEITGRLFRPKWLQLWERTRTVELKKETVRKKEKKDVSHSTLSPVMFHGPYPFSDFVMNPSILRDIYLECILVASSGNNHITCTPGLSLWLAPKTWTHPTTYTSVWILGSM